MKTMAGKEDLKDYGLATNATVEIAQRWTPTQSLLIDQRAHIDISGHSELSRGWIIADYLPVILNRLSRRHSRNHPYP
jgi:hypothetical protein